LNTIRREIAACMTDLTESNHVLTSHFTFPDDFVGFQGHFPARKILPGVCQIQCVRFMLERWSTRTVALKEIVGAKYFAPIVPSEQVTCTCKEVRDTSEIFVLKAVLTKGEQKISEIKLKVRFVENNAEQ